METRFRHIAVLTAATLLDQHQQLEINIEAALADSLSAEAICEVFVHTMLYGGSVRMQQAVDIAMSVFSRKGLVVSIEPLAHTLGAEEIEAGARMKDELHGARQDLGHANPNARFADALYSLATNFGYGHIWCRDGLSLKDRLVCAVAGFAVLADTEASFSKFSQAAAENGCSVLEIQEIVVQTMPYVGFPRALKALMLMEEIFPA